MLKRFTTQHFFHCFSFVIQLVHVWTQTLKHLYFAPGRLLVFYPGGGGVLLILAYSGRLRREKGWGGALYKVLCGVPDIIPSQFYVISLEKLCLWVSI